MNTPTKADLEGLSGDPIFRQILDGACMDAQIEGDPVLVKLTLRQRERVKVVWRAIDKWLDRLDRIKKTIIGR